jgi:hypothetical protein
MQDRGEPNTDIFYNSLYLSLFQFFDASNVARSFRKRYDALPNLLSKIEPVYTWSDPAEVGIYRL